MGNNKALVLNNDFRALTVCEMEKAFLLVYLNKAELIAPSKDSVFHTVSATYPAPSIIRLMRYVNLPYKNVVLSRQNIFKRDGHRCQYCGSVLELTIDHILPRSRGGLPSWDNLVTACKSCNSKKGDSTPEEAGMPLLSKPYRPSFIIFLRDFSGHIKEEWMPYLGKRSKIQDIMISA
jgi:5-methylcytosine-specific restriction endonuclease McrA